MKLEVTAKTREAQGTGASRRLRRDGMVPGVLYGGNKAPVLIEVIHNDLIQSLKVEAFHASLLTLHLDDAKETVLLRDFQMHPFKPQVYHVDFQRVDAKQEITMKIPLHFVNAEISPGVKLAGGIINHVINEVEIRCLPKDLPESITVDLSNLEAGRAIHMSEISWPKGVKPVSHTSDDLTIVTCNAPSVDATDSEGDEAGEAEE